MHMVGRRIYKILPQTISVCFRAAPWCSCMLMVIMFAQGLVPVAVLRLMQKTTDTLVDSAGRGAPLASWNGAGVLMLLLLAALLLQEILRTATACLTEIQGQRVTEKICESAFAKSLRLELAAFEAPAHFDQAHRVLNEAPHRPPMVFRSLITIASGLVTLTGIAYVIATIQWAVLPVLILLTIPGILWGAAHVRRVHRHWQEWTPDTRWMEYYADVLSHARHALVIRLLRIGPLFLSRMLHLQEKLHRRESRDILHGAAAELSFAALTLTGTFGLLWWAVDKALAGILSAGALVMLFQALRRLHAEVQSVAGAGLHLFQNLLFLEQYENFMEREEHIEVPVQGPGAVLTPHEHIHFANVSFTYPGTACPALQNIEISLPIGKTIALVGPNGSGKSTFLKLLTRLYDPDTGSILLDDKNIRDIPITDYRQTFSMLHQGEGGFDLTVAENIGLGDEIRMADVDRILYAANRAGIAQRVEIMPNGFESMLGKAFETGTELSAGEWRKLLLARAFFRDAPVLILDEPLASLDACSETLLVETMTKGECHGSTRIIASHRLAVMRQADMILVFKNGHVAETGNFDELINRKGEFFHIYQSQAKLYPCNR